jgi:hypothetical protein
MIFPILYETSILTFYLRVHLNGIDGAKVTMGPYTLSLECGSNTLTDITVPTFNNTQTLKIDPTRTPFFEFPEFPNSKKCPS